MLSLMTNFLLGNTLQNDVVDVWQGQEMTQSHKTPLEAGDRREQFPVNSSVINAEQRQTYF